MKTKTRHTMFSVCGLCFCVAALAAVMHAVSAAETKVDSAESNRIAKKALSEFNTLIGEWRGTAQPKRGSNRGAWQQSAEWVWEFKEGKPGIRYQVKDGKLMKSALLSYDAKSKTYRLNTKDGSRKYTGKLKGKVLALQSEADETGYVHRITIRVLNEKRSLVLHEKRRAKSSFYTRIAEVGYTRQGTSLAVAGADGPECVVTGGKGTSKVSYKGKDYYVCCSGCRQAFEDDPETIIADYKKKLAARKAAKKKSK